MALLTPLPLEAARQLGTAWNLEVEVVEPLAAGSVNSNFKLRTRSGAQWFARIYEEQSEAGAAAELALVRALLEAGVPAVPALTREDGGAITLYQGKPLAVFPWVEGEILCQKRVTVDACQKLGAALAQLHGSTSRLPRLPTGRFHVPDLMERLNRVEQSGRHDLLPAVERIRKGFEFYLPRRTPKLPKGVIHGDLFRDNVLWNQGALAALLDFDSASEGFFAYDLMTTVLGWCYSDRFELSLVSALLAGYSTVRPLSKEEALALPVEAALGCLRFASTRLTDYALRVPKGAKPIREYARLLERLDALEAGAVHSCFAAQSGAGGRLI